MCILVLISVRASSVHHRKLKMFSLTCLIYFLSFSLQKICCKNGFAFDYCFSENDADFSYSYNDYLIIFQSSSFDWYSGEEGIVFDETGNDPFHLCPSVHLCNSTGNNPLCSCQPSCIVLKTCCYDAPILKHQSVPGFKSASLLDQWREEYFICVETSSSPLRGHHMIGICPLNWEDDVIRRKCEDVSPFLKEEENLDLSNPLSITPVVGAGNVTFRNSFCAICHSVNIMTLQPWKMEINCPASAIERFQTNSSNGLSNLGSKCNVGLLKPPKGVTNLAVLPCLPHEATSSQCKADISPTTELEKKCETYLAPICGSDGVVYKNPQCLLCTYADNAYPLGYKGFYCPKLNESLSENTPLLGQGRLENIVPLSIIFDFSSQSGVRFESEGFVYTERTLPCNNGQVFDPFQGSCITFACTEGYKFSNGKCNPTFTENSCNRSNSTPEGVMKISFTSSSQSTLEIVNQHAQICVTDLLAMPFNSIYSRENSNPSLSINLDSISLSQGPQNTVDLEFMINFNSTNVLTLLENLIAFQFINQSTAIPPSEVQGRESIAMKQVCDAISRIRFEYRCEEIELECPTRLTRESKWSVNAINESNSVYFPQSQHSIVLTDTNINVDISFSGRRVTNFTSSAFYCRSLKCPTVTLNASLFDIVSQNGKAHLQHVSLRNFTVPEHSFEFLKEGLVKICSSFFLQNGTYSDQQRESFFLYSQLQTYISTVGLCTSIVCLWVTLATYLAFPSLRKAVSNKLVMTFCFMLSLAQTLLLVLALPTSLPIVCTLVAMTSHYSWLVTFLSTTMLGFDLNQAFAWAPVTHQQGGGMARFIKYLSICFGLPFCIVLPFAVIHFVLDKDAPFNYGSDRVCWISNPKWNFYVLGVPLGLCMTFNLVFFVHTVYAINNTRKQMAKMNDIGERNSMQDFLVFLKISLQLGITWSVSFIANITGSTVAWYIFIILNSLQGVIVLIVLMLSSRVRKLWGQKLGFTSETPRCTVSTISTPQAGISQVDTKV